jgi:serine phosphatase RsbU (regulator of sigma subunit)
VNLIKEILSSKVFIILIILISIGISTFNFFVIASSTTDENIFIDVPTKVVLKEKLNVKLINSNSDEIFDTLKKGTFIIAINNQNVVNDSTLDKALNSLSNEKTTITAINVINNKKIVYIVETNSLSDSVFYSFKSAVYVTHVEVDGASDKAGMNLGDIIFKVNGLEFENGFDATKHLNKNKNSSKIYYDVYRDGELIILDVTLAKFGVDTFILLRYLIGILLFSLALRYSLFEKHKMGEELRLTIIYFFISIGFLIGFSINFSIYLYSYLELIRNVSTSLIFIGIVYLNDKFISIVPNKSSQNHTTPILNKIKVAILLCFTFAFITNDLLIGNLKLNLLIIAALFIFCILLIGLNFYEKHLKFDRRNILKLVIAFNPIVCILIFDYYQESLNLNRLKGNILTLFLLYLPLIIIVTLAYFNKLETIIRIKKNIIYTVISTLWISIVLSLDAIVMFNIIRQNFEVPNLALRGLTIEVLNNPLPRQKEAQLEKFLIICISLFLITFSLYIYRKVQSIIDNKFYRLRNNYESSAEQLFQIFKDNARLTDIADLLSEKLLDILQLKRVGIVVFKDNRSYTQSYMGFNYYSFAEYINAIDLNLYNHIKNYNKSLEINELPSEFINTFQDYKFEQITPLYSKSKLLGFILSGEKKSESKAIKSDIQLLENIATQSAIAIENSFLYEDLTEKERFKHELEIARKIQLASLPQDLPEIEKLDISGMSLPALEVGGDFFDIFHKDDLLSVIVGDVSGKGTSAAFYMSKIQGILRAINDFEVSPKNILIRTNKLIYKYIDKNYFITALIVQFKLNENIALISRAGHLPLYKFDAKNSTITKLLPKGLVIGVNSGNFFDKNLEEISTEFSTNDVFVLISDGVLEARNSNDKEYSEDRFLKLLHKNIHFSSNQIKDSIINDLKSFTGDMVQFDDVTIVVVKVK